LAGKGESGKEEDTTNSIQRARKEPVRRPAKTGGNTGVLGAKQIRFPDQYKNCGALVAGTERKRLTMVGIQRIKNALALASSLAEMIM